MSVDKWFGIFTACIIMMRICMQLSSRTDARELKWYLSDNENSIYNFVCNVGVIPAGILNSVR